MIDFEKEIIEYLGLPSIPKREWTKDDGRSFDKGVAVIELYSGHDAYAACSYCPDKGHTEPIITKVFSIEPFKTIKNIFVVPDYMTSVDDVKSMDLDDESKRKAMQLLEEASEIENDGVEDDERATQSIESLPEWIFSEIENREQAMAWIRQYNKRNGIKKGRIPSNDEAIKLRLYAIYSSIQKKPK